MNRAKKLLLIVFVVTFSIFTPACTKQQGRVGEAQKAVKVPDKSHYFERQQIADSETLNDRPGKVYWWYILANDGRLITSFTCVGRPASSTESLEPNNMSPYNGSGWEVPLEDGQNGYTTEAMGLDGTYGEPVPFRYCISPEGHYYDVSQFQNSIVTSIPLNFAQPQVRFDEQLEAKKLVAEQTLKKGGCIDSNLNPIDCNIVKKNKED